MIKETTYRVQVSIDTDFAQGWGDQRVPNMVFNYDQESIDECEEVDGIYYATYRTWVVTESRTMTYSLPDGTRVTIPVAVGEYGVKP